MLNELCFLADTAKDGFCVMALGDETAGGNNSNSEVSLSADELVVELDTLNDALHSRDRLLKRDVRERNDFKAKH